MQGIWTRMFTFHNMHASSGGVLTLAMVVAMYSMHLAVPLKLVLKA